MVPGCLHSEFQNLDLDKDEAQDFEKTTEVARTCLRSQDPKASNQRPKCRIADQIFRYSMFSDICRPDLHLEQSFSFAGCANQPG